MTMSTIRTASQVRAGDATVIYPYFTLIVPVMNGCIEQWYATVPAAANVWVNVWPLASAADVKELSFAATVCWVESSNFQVTVVPAETDRVVGVNMKFLISTVDPPPAVAEPVGAVADADGGVVPPDESEPQAVTTASTAGTATRPASRRAGRT
jgi:hypothetical protein